MEETTCQQGSKKRKRTQNADDSGNKRTRGKAEPLQEEGVLSTECLEETTHIIKNGKLS